MSLRHAAGGVAAMTAVGMAAGLGVDVLVAARLGATGVADALILGLTIPLVLETVLREGSKFSLVPLMIVEGAKPGAELVGLSGLLNFFALTGGVLVALIVLAAPLLLNWLGSGLSASDHALAVTVLKLSVPLVALSLVGNCLAAYLNARDVFIAPAARYAAVSFTVLAGAVFMSSRDSFVMAVASFTVLGYLVYLFVLWRLAKRAGWKHSWRDWPTSKEMKVLRHQLSWPTAGFFAGQMMRVAERALASVVAPGAVTLYYFAFRVFNAVRNLVGMSIATVVLPGLARRHRVEDHEALVRSVRRAVVAALLMLLPVCLALILFSQSIVSLLFARGEFSATAVEDTAGLLQILSGALLLFGITPVLMSALYARRRQRTVFGIMIITAAVNLLFMMTLSVVLGLEGIALAFVCAGAVQVALALFLGRQP